MTDAPAPSKSDSTRQKIVSTAMELFRERGYDKTTMRAIADSAGMSIGSTYYYFRSKEDLVQGFYSELLNTYLANVKPALTGHTALSDRLAIALKTWVDSARPHHDFAANFFRFVADPKSPLSPFSSESAETRDAAINVFRKVVAGSRTKVSAPLDEQLPELLWLYQMGVVLFWTYDDSPDQSKTVHLIERTAPMVTRLIGFARLPGLKNVAKDVVSLIGEMKVPATRT